MRTLIFYFAWSTLFAAQSVWPSGSPTPAAQTFAQVLAASQASDWRGLDPDNTIYLELATGRVVIELAPVFAPRHVANVKRLARQHYYDGLSILRVQDN